MTRNDFLPPDPRALRKQRAFAALERISSRHADTTKRRSRAWNSAMISPLEAVRLVAVVEGSGQSRSRPNPQADRDDIVAALTLTTDAHSDLDLCEAALISAARARGLSWSEIAFALGLGSAQAAQKRYRRVSNAEHAD